MHAHLEDNVLDWHGELGCYGRGYTGTVALLPQVLLSLSIL